MYLETYHGRTRAELRSPDASGNPYLVYALLIHAGLYGIQHATQLPLEMDENGALLPGSRKEAAKLAKESPFIREIVPEELIRTYARH